MRSAGAAASLTVTKCWTPSPDVGLLAGMATKRTRALVVGKCFASRKFSGLRSAWASGPRDALYGVKGRSREYHISGIEKQSVCRF
jgi:hypothetical protein